MNTPERIWLIETDNTIVWHHSPKPSPTITSEQVQEYIRADTFPIDPIELQACYKAWRASYTCPEAAAEQAFKQAESFCAAFNRLLNKNSNELNQLRAENNALKAGGK